MTTRVLSSEPIAFILDAAPTVDAAETSIGVVTVNGSTIAAIDASLAGKVGEAPIDGIYYARRNAGWSSFTPPSPAAGLVIVTDMQVTVTATAG